MTTRHKSRGKLFVAGVLGALVAVFLMGQTLQGAGGGQTIQTDGQVEALGFIGDGSNLTNVLAADSDLLDTLDSTAFARSAHTHQAADVVGTLPRKFYLAAVSPAGNVGWTGSQALTACFPGYHMASFWEIADVSVLRYEGSVPGAFPTFDRDLGSGPPSGEPTPTSFGIQGWVRTGGLSAADPIPGRGNCLLWHSSGSDDSGTVAGRSTDWIVGPNIPGTSWFVDTFVCNSYLPVWCIQDWPPAGTD